MRTKIIKKQKRENNELSTWSKIKNNKTFIKGLKKNHKNKD
jgi:hypothetical protein